MQILKQFSRFIVVGVLNTGVDVLLYFSLTRLSEYWSEHQVMAAIISAVVATVHSYVWNKLWTFNDTQNSNVQTFSKFALITATGLVAHTALFSWLIGLGAHDILSKGAAIIMVTFWNFTLYKFWAFAQK